jgi:hypothetical protein
MLRTNHRVHKHLETANKRLCQRPERRPGVAPPCEDDNIKSPGDYMKVGKPVTLPKLQFLEGRT